MKLADLDKVTAIKNYRARTIVLRNAANSSSFECRVGGMEVSSIIDVAPIRQAIFDAADAQVQRYNIELNALGVEL
jgi:hypothetical protein